MNGTADQAPIPATPITADQALDLFCDSYETHHFFRYKPSKWDRHLAGLVCRQFGPSQDEWIAKLAWLRYSDTDFADWVRCQYNR